MGCGTSVTAAAPSPPVPAPSTALTGYVQAGKQEVSGASVSLYAVGSSGNGAGATNLLPAQAIVSDANGAFSIPSEYTCPSANTLIYLVTRGGTASASAGVLNKALTLITAVGACGSVNAAKPVFVNELTTVAGACALSLFLGEDANVGSSATNSLGLQNAFALAANLAGITTGSAPGSSLTFSAKLELAKLNSLAAILSTCANSSGGNACSSLFSMTSIGGVTPSNTLDAALAVVRHPGNNVAALYNLQASAALFQPSLAAAPNDWTLSITYGVCSSGCGGLNIPGALAMDSTGNVWVANYFGSAVSKFSALGVPASANGFPGSGLYHSYGIAVDGTDNIWVTNETSPASPSSRRGSISRFSSSGTELSGTGYTAGGVYYPHAIAGDPNGTMWVADYGSSSASLLASDGTGISGTSGYAASLLPFTTAVAVDANHNGWFAFEGGAARVSSNGAVTTFACCNEPSGIAVDANGAIWLADYGGQSVVKLSASGTVIATASTAAANVSPAALAIDGNGSVWTANYYGNSFTELAGSSVSFLSPVAGYGLDAGLNEPYAVAVDASGDLWFSDAGNNTLTEIIGVAGPIRTPLLGAPVQP